MPNQPQEIKIADNFPGAEYTNAAQFNHNREEFQMYFLNIAGNTGRVVSKLITNPSHFKRLYLTMRDNLKKYEDKFGPIDESEEVSKGIGFKA